jgi:protein SCO1
MNAILTYVERRTRGNRRIFNTTSSASSASPALIVVAVLLFATTVFAQMGGTTAAGYKREPGMPASTMPAPLREIGFDQNIGQRLPLDTDVVDESGRTVRIGSYFRARPVILVFAYYSCPMLCTQVINGLASAVGVLSLEPGRDFDVVVVSFDPRDTPETATAKKAQYLERYTAAGAATATHFLTATEPAIDRLTKSAGFHFVWDKQTQQFAHPTGVIVMTPDGRMARYLFGIEYGPRDLRLAVVEASEGKVGNAVDTLLLYCYHYDPMTGRYGVAIMRTLRVAGASTVLALGAFVFVMFRREKRQRVP